METLREFYRIGIGPSSSHTIGPRRAAEIFKSRFPRSSRVQVTLFGSLAATGMGHLTDKAIQQVIPNLTTEFIRKPGVEVPLHPNRMHPKDFNGHQDLLSPRAGYSLGGLALAYRPANRPSIPS